MPEHVCALGYWIATLLNTQGLGGTKGPDCLLIKNMEMEAQEAEPLARGEGSRLLLLPLFSKGGMGAVGVRERVSSEGQRITATAL